MSRVIKKFLNRLKPSFHHHHRQTWAVVDQEGQEDLFPFLFIRFQHRTIVSLQTQLALYSLLSSRSPRRRLRHLWKNRLPSSSKNNWLKWRKIRKRTRIANHLYNQSSQNHCLRKIHRLLAWYKKWKFGCRRCKAITHGRRSTRRRQSTRRCKDCQKAMIQGPNSTQTIQTWTRQKKVMRKVIELLLPARLKMIRKASKILAPKDFSSTILSWLMSL